MTKAKKFKQDEGFDFAEDANWRIFRIMAEFIDGFEFLSKLRNEVSIFGSARCQPTDRYYKVARELGRLLGRAHFTVITGGGPGIMEAANRGAYEAGADSIGLNIQLPNEQRTNRYVKKGVGFHYFFTRKVMLSVSAQAYVFFPGGFGTLDEFSEIITLIQTKKTEKLPIVLVGKEFWQPFDDWIRQVVLGKFKGIAPGDRKLYHIVDTAQEAFDLIKNSKERKYF